MKVILGFILVMSGMLVLDQRQLFGRTLTTSQEKKEPSLALTAEVASMTYCSGDDEVATMQIELRLRYTNLVSQPAILYRGSGDIMKVILSRTEREAELGHIDFEMTLSNYAQGSDKVHFSSPPNASFTRLRKAEFLEVRRMVPIPFKRRKGTGQYGGVTQGKHVLQVVTSIWPDSRSAAETLRRKWSDKGMLWFHPVTSVPMPFEIVEPPTLKACE